MSVLNKYCSKYGIAFCLSDFQNEHKCFLLFAFVSLTFLFLCHCLFLSLCPSPPLSVSSSIYFSLCLFLWVCRSVLTSLCLLIFLLHFSVSEYYLIVFSPHRRSIPRTKYRRTFRSFPPSRPPAPWRRSSPGSDPGTPPAWSGRWTRRGRPRPRSRRYAGAVRSCPPTGLHLEHTSTYLVQWSLVKNLWGGVGIKFVWKFYSRFEKIPRGSKNFFFNVFFFPKKSKFASKMPIS